MARLEDLTRGAYVKGLDPSGPVKLIEVKWHGTVGVELVYKDSQGALQEETGPGNVEALRSEIPGLYRLAELIHGKEPRGVLAPKPSHSDSGDEWYIFDFLGMLGIPLVPSTTVRAARADDYRSAASGRSARPTPPR